MILVATPSAAAQSIDECVPGDVVGKIVDLLPVEPKSSVSSPQACVSLTPTSLARSFAIVEDVGIIDGPQVLIAQSVNLTTFNGVSQAAVGVGQLDPCALYSSLDPFVTCSSTTLFGPVTVEEKQSDPVFGDICVYNADLTVTFDGETIHDNPFAATAAKC